MRGVVRRRPLRHLKAGPATLLALLAGVLGTYLVLAPSPDAEALRLADRFLDLYMEPSGRVVRRDQGADTVSEGQAYAMLLAAASNDEERFETAWTWTKENLQRPDGLLSYLWARGRVQDEQPATDADLDAAHALLVAARRFGEQRYRAEAFRIARGILRSETVETAVGRLLVAGPWARSEPYKLNPSYFSPLALTALAKETGDQRWQEVLRTSYELTARLTANAPALPPDWVDLRRPIVLDPVPPPGGGGDAAYGYEGARVPVRMAAACEAQGAELAARPWPFLGRQGTRLAARYRLDGRPLGGRHALSAMAAAAAAYAAGERPAGERLLARAQALDRGSPTYYGAAWVALGRVLLTTERIRRCS